MKITKDEARILAYAMEATKHELNDLISYQAKKKGIDSFGVFEKLEHRLSEFSKDKRRVGRRSHDDMFDCLNRYVSKP